MAPAFAPSVTRQNAWLRTATRYARCAVVVRQQRSPQRGTGAEERGIVTRHEHGRGLDLLALDHRGRADRHPGSRVYAAGAPSRICSNAG